MTKHRRAKLVVKNISPQDRFSRVGSFLLFLWFPACFQSEKSLHREPGKGWTERARFYGSHSLWKYAFALWLTVLPPASINKAADRQSSGGACGFYLLFFTKLVLKYVSEETVMDLGDPLSLSVLPFLGQVLTLPMFSHLIFNITFFQGIWVLLTPFDPYLLLALSFSPPSFLISFLFFSRLLHLSFFDTPLLPLASFLVCSTPEISFFYLQFLFRGISTDIDVKGKGILHDRGKNEAEG